MRTRSLLAAPAAAALLLAGVGGVAAAQEQPTAECTAAKERLTELQGELAAAIEVDNANGAIEDSEAVIELKSQVEATTGLVAEECAPPEPEPTTDPTPTTQPPAPEDTDPPYETCAEAIEAGEIVPAVRGINDSYQPNLDSDGDGVACEANEGAGTPPTDNGDNTADDDNGSSGGDFSQLDDVPSVAAETGGGPA